MNHIDNKSTMEIQELLSKYENSNDYIDLAQSTIYQFKNLIEKTINKLLAFGHYPEFNKNMLGLKTDSKRTIELITFALSFVCL